MTEYSFDVILCTSHPFTNYINYHIFHRKTVMRSKEYREQFQIFSRIIAVDSPLELINSIIMGCLPDLWYQAWLCYYEGCLQFDEEVVDLSESTSATIACSGISWQCHYCVSCSSLMDKTVDGISLPAAYMTPFNVTKITSRNETSWAEPIWVLHVQWTKYACV